MTTTRTLPAPGLEHVCDLAVSVSAPIDAGVLMGLGTQGRRRIIPITGGIVTGQIQGRVLPGGADFQLLVSDRLAELDARYVMETDGGDMIYVQNRAVRSGPAELMARLVRGEPVDPAQIYFRCSPSFETASPALAWITERMFAGSGARHPDRVVMQFFELA